ncbi:MAG: flagellar hook-length control protein FliK, partial [Epsilonproteobacteria bacterium]
KKVEVHKQTEPAKSTLLFKAQSSLEHTTEQIVSTKQFKVEVKTPKEKADETLKLLLRGEKPSSAKSPLTADFSVVTPRVIAPSPTSDVNKSLETLLHGEQSDSTTLSKTDGLITAHKADSFEVKLNEAKQMIKYLSQDVKSAIEDYKSPFTRVKVQLNPQKLGEVDLTIVQRGKNLHVNISSNSAAINTLSMNANELRVQLSSSGINNATLNFNSGSENGSSTNEHQQNRQNEQNRASEEYRYFNNEEQNEEILSSLEIVVPNYA